MAKKIRTTPILFVSIIIVAAISFSALYRNRVAPVSTPVTGNRVSLEVSFLDVGQADCAVIRSGSAAMLIDAGGNATSPELVAALAGMGIRKFDVVIGTHPDEDHVGGLDAVIMNFYIGELYLPDVGSSTRTFEDVLASIKEKGLTISEPVPGSRFMLGKAECEILAPNSSDYPIENDYSIVIKLTYGKTAFLFTGDAERRSEQEMLAKSYALKSDVLKVGHHGSDESTTASFLAAVAPRYAVISVGADNGYGHPKTETLRRLAAANVGVFRTDRNGTVTFISDGINLQVHTER